MKEVMRIVIWMALFLIVVYAMAYLLRSGL